MANAVKTSEFQEIELNRIKPNRLNPRMEFRKEALDELADSIEQSGLVEPIIVRPFNKGFEVVVGERRYRAAQQAGLFQIPAIVREYTDDEVLELNLIENIQREDLSAVEKGKTCQQLLKRFPSKYPSMDTIAKHLGVDRRRVGEWIELVENVPEEIQRMVEAAPFERHRMREGTIDYGTALRIKQQIEEPKKQIEVARSLAEHRMPRKMASEVIKGVAKEPAKSVQKVVEEVTEAPYDLPFRLSHMEPILKGLKTQTTRKGIPDPRVRVGAIVHAAVWEPQFADLRVDSIDRKRLGDFTEEDARREGGYNLAEFKKVWEKIHKEPWNPNESVMVLRFRLEKASRES